MPGVGGGQVGSWAGVLLRVSVDCGSFLYLLAHTGGFHISCLAACCCHPYMHVPDHQYQQFYLHLVMLGST